MKLIILAAGQGTRLWKYTRNNPKGMIEFAGKSLLKHQIDNFQKYGINDIIVIRGYLKEKIQFPEIKYYDNDKFSETNMVESLMCAELELDTECIVTYSDIIFDGATISKIVESVYDIGVTVDVSFKDYWKARLEDKYSEDMESLVISGNKIVNLGKPFPKSNEVDGRYVGAMKFSSKGIKNLVNLYRKLKKFSPLNSMQNRAFEKWHMTDLLQATIEDGLEVNAITVSKGWLEFDTEKDYELYNKWYQERIIKRFINL